MTSDTLPDKAVKKYVVATVRYYTEDGDNKKCSVFVVLSVCRSDGYRPWYLFPV